MKKIILFLLILCTSGLQAQVNDTLVNNQQQLRVNDPFYREDQFYIGITHSLYLDTPEGFKQNSISAGFQIGTLRDIPINEKRTWAIAPGIGLSTYNMRTNWLVLDPQQNDYEVNSNYTKNKQNFYFLDIPIEIRWRTSTIQSYKFWRIYSGFRYSYLLASDSRYQGYYGNIKHSNDKNLNRSHFGAYISAGFNTWNFQAYYGFTPMYKSATNTKGMHTLHLGLMFYIL